MSVLVIGMLIGILVGGLGLASAGLGLHESRIDFPGGFVDVYVDETFDPYSDPVVVRRTHLPSVMDEFTALRSACPVNRKEVAGWIGGNYQQWQPLQEGERLAWTFHSDAATVLQVPFGRLQVNEGDMIQGDMRLVHDATFRCISSHHPDFTLGPRPAPCPINTDGVSAIFNGYLPASTFTGPEADGAFVYNGDPFTFQVAEGPIKIVSPAGEFVSGQTVPETVVFSFYCGSS